MSASSAATVAAWLASTPSASSYLRKASSKLVRRFSWIRTERAEPGPLFRAALLVVASGADLPLVQRDEIVPKARRVGVELLERGDRPGQVEAQMSRICSYDRSIALRARRRIVSSDRRACLKRIAFRSSSVAATSGCATLEDVEERVGVTSALLRRSPPALRERACRHREGRVPSRNIRAPWLDRRASSARGPRP